MKFRESPIVNAGSMADIAFTMLIFFLVSTTLAVDQGEKVLLSPINECLDCELPVHHRNLLVLEVLENGKLLLENKPFEYQHLKNEAIIFLQNNGKNPEYSDSYDVSVIKVITHNNSPYSAYLETFTNVKAAFQAIRNEESLMHFDKKYEFLNERHQLEIRNDFPLKIVEELVE